MSSRVLVVAPAWIGDMVMAQSLFITLRKRAPSLHIDVLAPTWSRPLLERMPEVKVSIPMPLGHGQLGLRERHRLGRLLGEKGYERAILLPNSFKSALAPFWAKIPLRTGFWGEMRWGLLNDIRILDKRVLPMMTQRFVALGLPPDAPMPPPVPKPCLQVAAANVARALRAHGLNAPYRPVLGICPGAEYGPAKRWPAEYYAEVGAAKLAAGWSVWIFGSKNDAPIGAEIHRRLGDECVDFTGRTTLAQAVDLMSLTRAVVSNDSGLLHVAAALGKRLIALYGSSDPSFTPPLTDRATILSLQLACSPCFRRQCPLGHLQCLRDLHPQQVIAALDE